MQHFSIAISQFGKKCHLFHSPMARKVIYRGSFLCRIKVAYNHALEKEGNMGPKQLSNSFSAPESGLSMLEKILLIGAFLAGIIIVWLAAMHLSASDSARKGTFMKYYNATEVVEPASDSQQYRIPEHDFSDISYPSDSTDDYPTRNPRIAYNIGGKSVLRRSELGPLTLPVDVSGMARSTGKGIIGMELAASPVAIDSLMPSPLICTIAGVTVVRRSELGSLADPPISSSIPLPRFDFSIHATPRIMDLVKAVPYYTISPR